MWNALKYGIWNVAQPEAGSVNALVAAGYAPLAAMVLASRGLGTEKEAADSDEEKEKAVAAISGAVASEIADDSVNA